MLDVLANLSSDSDYWVYKLDFWDHSGADFVSSTATYLNELMNLDPTSVKMLLKEWE